MSDEIWVEENESTEFEAPPEDQHIAKVGGVWDVGMQKGYLDKPPKRKVCVAFELDARDSKGRRFVMFAPYTMSLFEKAPLRHLLDNLFPKEPKERFNVRRIVGADCLVTVGSTEGGKAKVTTVAALPKQMAGSKIASLEHDYAQPFGLAKYLIENQLKAKKSVAAKPAESVAAEVESDFTPEDPPF